MDNFIISVVVPIYNGEKFIDRCMASLLDQDTDELEIILVDDGSIDGSGAICDHYAAENDRVRVVHKVNGGLSSARNAGIRVANGEYVSFVDVDDYLAKNAYNEIIDVIRDNLPDFIDFGWKYVALSGHETLNLHGLPKNKLLPRKVIEEYVLPPLLNLREDSENFIYDFACTKVFRRDIILRDQVWFDEKRRIWEDRPFVVHYLKYCNNLYSMDRCYYYYCDTPNSLGRSYSMKFFDIILDTYRHYTSLYSGQYDFSCQYAFNYWAKSIQKMIFRSLEQTTHQEEIWGNMLRILQDVQVICWFRERMPENSFEQRMSRLVIAGNVEGALKLCVRQKSKIDNAERWKKWVRKGKNAVKRMIRRE